MKVLTIILVLISLSVSCQTYLHPTTGVQSTYNGACLTSTCAGTSYDNGGAGSNYAANVNNIYRTFCPNTAGSCMRATFTSFSMNDTYFLCYGPSSCCDYLQILNGATQDSPALYNNCTTSPGTITSTATNGCLTFRFVSDGSVQLGGWAATLSCVACAGGPVASNSDCANATLLCANTALNDASTGPGLVAEGCAGCNISESHSNWYQVNVLTTGTLAFTIDPNSNTDDFDPTLYGPDVTCAALGTPIRCSYASAAGNGNTGMGNGAVDASEDATGDQWTSALNVTAGQRYFLMVNARNVTSNTNGFQINFTGTCGLDCTPLPMGLTSFYGEYSNGAIDLTWNVENGIINDHYILEKSIDGNWVEIVKYTSAASNSYYLFTDTKPFAGDNSYRVKIVDKNAEVLYSRVETVSTNERFVFNIFPNPASDEIYIDLLDATEIQYPISISNSMGQVLKSIPNTPGAGSLERYTTSVKDLNAGLYVVQYGSEVRTLLIQD